MMRFFRRLGKRGQTGQSLVILAIGFLALLGFVGIVTDVSVLFIRYSTMRRAVDAAAIAAAGQMRRVQDTKIITNPSDPGYDPLHPNGVADGQATSIANLNLAARQFIEVYGLNPKSVVVETCGTQEVPRDVDGNATDQAGHPLMVLNAGKPEPNKGQVTGIPAADPTLLANYLQLCTTDELKLVRVTAQIDAPTIFLRLLGYPTVTLTESAISQTAVIDVVMIFDVAESMANETTYTDWDNIPSDPTKHLGVYYMPAFIDPSPWYTAPGYPIIDQMTQSQLNIMTAYVAHYTPDCYPNAPADDAMKYDPNCFLRHHIVRFEPTTALNVVPAAGSDQWQEWTGATTPGGVTRTQPRVFCQTRGYMGTLNGGAIADNTLLQAYQDFFNRDYINNNAGQDFNFMMPHGRIFRGFVPQYNYYGCCNDPLGQPDASDPNNYSFKDLICQPFKDARDAAHDFLGRLDFLRGDRIAFVTYDRQAYIVDPDGADVKVGNTIIPGGPQGAMLESQSDILDPVTHAIVRQGADGVLDRVVGVGADGTGYSDNGLNGVGTVGFNDGRWDHLLDGGVSRTYDQLLNDVNIGDIITNPVLKSCSMDNAVIQAAYLPTSKKSFDAATTMADGATLMDTVITIPSWYYSSPLLNPLDESATITQRSYEFRAPCGGGNVGGALEAGSATLYSEGRREGAVWIMVLMSDGAAGASNPITKYNTIDISPANPYETIANSSYIAPQPGQFGPDTSPQITGNAGYGFFGLCPYGTLAQPSQLLSNNNTDWYPFCNDLKPETRHFCGALAVIPDSALDNDPNCFQYYNVDDYSRDWADWVGVADLKTQDPNDIGRVSQQLLPTIFTIGFGINYDTAPGSSVHVAAPYLTSCGSTDYNCMRGLDQTMPSGLTAGQQVVVRRTWRDRNSDYLGEELLRYIADVGDNNQIDSDYWQLCLSAGKVAPYSPPCRLDDGSPAPSNPSDRIPNKIDLNTSPANWGARGACENEYPAGQPQNLRGNVYDPKPPMQPCGNYFVAATQQQLETVFDQIASRMFTRLSQ